MLAQVAAPTSATHLTPVLEVTIVAIGQVNNLSQRSATPRAGQVESLTPP